MAEPPGFCAISSLLRLQRSMTAVVDQELKVFRLRLIDYQLLKELQAADGVRLLGEVARQLMVHATTVSIASDRLTNRGLVTRRTHPSDRRATLVAITEDGRAVADAATAALGRVDFGLDVDAVAAVVDAIAHVRADAAERVTDG